MTDDMTAEKAAELRKPFPKSAIGKLPKGGVQLDYVGHAATTDRLLAVDPHWTWEPFATDDRGLPALDSSGNLWIRLTVCGVTRIGVGDGKNAKEVIGDAIRNAAMRFGVALDLWSKEELEQVSEVAPIPAREPMADKTRARMFALFNELGIDEDAQRDGIARVVGHAVESRGSITETEARRVIAALEAKQKESTK